MNPDFRDASNLSVRMASAATANSARTRTVIRNATQLFATVMPSTSRHLFRSKRVLLAFGVRSTPRRAHVSRCPRVGLSTCLRPDKFGLAFLDEEIVDGFVEQVLQLAPLLRLQMLERPAGAGRKMAGDLTGAGARPGLAQSRLRRRRISDHRTQRLRDVMAVIREMASGFAVCFIGAPLMLQRPLR